MAWIIVVSFITGFCFHFINHRLFGEFKGHDSHYKVVYCRSNYLFSQLWVIFAHHIFSLFILWLFMLCIRFSLPLLSYQHEFIIPMSCVFSSSAFFIFLFYWTKNMKIGCHLPDTDLKFVRIYPCLHFVLHSLIL